MDKQNNAETPAERIAKISQELAVLQTEAEQYETPAGGDLVPQRSSSPDIAKRQMAELSAQAQKHATKIRAKTDELEKVMQQQMRLARETMKPLEEMVKRLKEGIWSVNLYLGRDEEIELLQDGAAAPKDTPITIRQMVLYMDEECAVRAEDGGIERKEIAEFDEWITASPENLNQVLPEEKGIVALTPRRNIKSSGNPWADIDKVKENAVTYFLIRNGDKVYRTVTDFYVGKHLLPTTKEFVQFFEIRDRAGELEGHLEPGSKKWEEAQERADARQRHFMRVALILEGLLHRTPIFHPLPDQGISFLDEGSHHSGAIKFINDAEDSLASGAETFKSWRKRLADQLVPGMRIALGPGLYDYRDERGGNERLTPRNAKTPFIGELYTLEERSKNASDGGFIFRYKRVGEVIYKDYYGPGHEPKRKAACVIYPDDSFVLPFDLAEVDDMKRFLSTRSDRANYIEMFPILQEAIALKAREAEEEAPFILMLSGVLARENNVSVAESQEAIPDLVKWWKFKNKNHRPLVGDEQHKAVSAIVKEHKLRLNESETEVSSELIEMIKRNNPNVIAVVLTRSGEYRALIPARADEKVFVHQICYTLKGKLKGTNEWKLVRPASIGWNVVYQTDAWTGWTKNASPSEHLSGPDLEEAVENLSQISTDPIVRIQLYKNDFYLQTIAKEAVLDADHPNSGENKNVEYSYMTYEWSRSGSTVKLSRIYNYMHPQFNEHHQGRMLYTDEVLAQKLSAQEVQYEEILKRSREIRSTTFDICDSVNKQWEALQWEAHRARFDEDYQDPDLWEGHKKSLRVDSAVWKLGHGHRVDRPRKVLMADQVTRLVELDCDFDGLTVAELKEFSKNVLGSGFEVPEEMLEFRVTYEKSETA